MAIPGRSAGLAFGCLFDYRRVSQLHRFQRTGDGGDSDLRVGAPLDGDRVIQGVVGAALKPALDPAEEKGSAVAICRANAYPIGSHQAGVCP